MRLDAGEDPPLEDSPRSSNSVWPGPLDFIETPGTSPTKEATLVMPRSSSCGPLSAVMLIGTLLMFSSRRVAVTTIS
jgi:hypothetical protein